MEAAAEQGERFGRFGPAGRVFALNGRLSLTGKRILSRTIGKDASAPAVESAARPSM